MLFIDYSSAFNTIVPSKLTIKLEDLGLDPVLCNWVLKGHSQVVKVGNNTSTSLILNTVAPQGRELSPLLSSLFTHFCVTTYTSNSIIKFADDTTVVGLISNNDESLQGEGEGPGSVVPGKKPLTQCQLNKGADRGLQETAEGAPPYPHQQNHSGEGRKLQVPQRRHH